MRFISSTGSTTHLRCADAIAAAFLAHLKHQEKEEPIQLALRWILGRQKKWLYPYHLPKNIAKETLTQCSPEITKKQRSTGLWKRKSAELISYGILRAFPTVEMSPLVPFVARASFRRVHARDEAMFISF